MYKDLDYEEKIEDAINKAIANLSLEGFLVTKEEKEKLKQEFLNNYKIKVLVNKKGNYYGKR